MEPLGAAEQVAQDADADIARMSKRVAKPRPHTLVEEDLGGVREAVRELDYKVEALDTKIDTKVDNAVATLNTKIDTKVDNAVATLNTKIDTVETTLNTKIDTAVATLDTKIDGAVATLDTKIDTAVATLDTKIDGVATELTTKIDGAVALLRVELVGMGKGIGEMKVWVRWGVIALLALMGAMVAIMGLK